MSFLKSSELVDSRKSLGEVYKGIDAFKNESTSFFSLLAELKTLLSADKSRYEASPETHEEVLKETVEQYATMFEGLPDSKTYEETLYKGLRGRLFGVPEIAELYSYMLENSEDVIPVIDHMMDDIYLTRNNLLLRIAKEYLKSVV